MGDWLAAVADELERETGTQLRLSRDEIDELLRVAAFAARESGAKLNAPLLCYLIGRAAAGSGRSVAELVEMVRAPPAAASWS